LPIIQAFVEQISLLKKDSKPYESTAHMCVPVYVKLCYVN